MKYPLLPDRWLPLEIRVTLPNKLQMGHDTNLITDLKVLRFPHAVAIWLDELQIYDKSIQGLAKRRAQGLVYFVPAVAYRFCQALPAAFTQPRDPPFSQAL